LVYKVCWGKRTAKISEKALDQKHFLISKSEGEGEKKGRSITISGQKRCNVQGACGIKKGKFYEKDRQYRN